MHGSDFEAAAKLIAENVVSAVMQSPVPPLRDTQMARDAAVIAVMIELLRIMPTEDSDRLADACNRGLGELVITGASGPVIEAVDPDDGSVMIRAR